VGLFVISVAKGPQNFGRKTQKRPTKMVGCRKNLGPNFWQIYQKDPKRDKTFL
jgi:hypothetical protein